VTLNEDLVECLKFVSRWREVSPKNFPKFLVNSMVALSDSTDIALRRASVDFLRELVLVNPLIVAWSGGIRILIDCIVDPLH
jgi:hypothetical protein